MAAAAQEEARKLHQAKEAFERATAMAEGVTMKAWKTADKQRREAAVRAAEAKAVALKRASDELAANRAAPCYMGWVAGGCAPGGRGGDKTSDKHCCMHFKSSAATPCACIVRVHTQHGNAGSVAQGVVASHLLLEHA